MNESNYPDSTSNVSWPTSDQRMRLPDSEKDEPAAIGLIKQAAQGAHVTIDRLADSATPAIQQLGERVSAAEDALHEKADQFRETRDEWVEGARTTVRSNPLVSVAAAFTLGFLYARITR